MEQRNPHALLVGTRTGAATEESTFLQTTLRLKGFVIHTGQAFQPSRMQTELPPAAKDLSQVTCFLFPFPVFSLFLF